MPRPGPEVGALWTQNLTVRNPLLPPPDMGPHFIGTTSLLVTSGGNHLRPIQTYWWLVTVTLVIVFVCFAPKFWEVYAASDVGKITSGMDT